MHFCEGKAELFPLGENVFEFHFISSCHGNVVTNSCAAFMNFVQHLNRTCLSVHIYEPDTVLREEYG
jgi:hypothetical protein